MNETDVSSDLSLRDVVDEYENHMDSDKAFINDELLELAEYMIYDSKLNKLELQYVSKRSHNFFDGVVIFGAILLDMTERNVVFNVPMITCILNDEKKRGGRCIDKRKMLLNMMKNGYEASIVQYKKINDLYIDFPIKYSIDNKFTCNQNEFELLPFEYSKLEKDLKNIKKIIRESNVEITDNFIDNLHKSIGHKNLYRDKELEKLYFPVSFRQFYVIFFI